jgi:AcrR family transcriptional regulator
MATPVKGMSTRAVQAERTRRQILETAQRLFAELGYDATSLQMIADELGLTKAAVYYHFRTKSEIMHAAMQPGLDRLEALLDAAAAIRGRRARTEYLVSGFVDFLVENRIYAGMAANDPAAKRDKAEESTTLRERGLALIFGDDPTGAQRLAASTLFYIPECLPDLADLSDEELREALYTMVLHMLRLPSPPRDPVPQEA